MYICMPLRPNQLAPFPSLARKQAEASSSRPSLLHARSASRRCTFSLRSLGYRRPACSCTTSRQWGPLVCRSKQGIQERRLSPFLSLSVSSGRRLSPAIRLLFLKRRRSYPLDASCSSNVSRSCPHVAPSRAPRRRSRASRPGRAPVFPNRPKATAQQHPFRSPTFVATRHGVKQRDAPQSRGRRS